MTVGTQAETIAGMAAAPVRMTMMATRATTATTVRARERAKARAIDDRDNG
jgi:hypothetical protein